MDQDGISLLLLLVLLVLTSAFFVAAEFSVLTLRRRRAEQSSRDENGRAAAVFAAADEADEISIVAQLISIGSVLLLGHLSALYAIRHLPRLDPIAAGAIGIAAAGLVHLVIGQQIPRLFGAQRATWVARPAVLLPLRILGFLLRPLVLLLSFLIDALSKSLHLSRSAFYAPVHTLEEIRDLVAQGHEQGVVEEDEREMIHGVFEFSETVAREVMTPRIDIVAFSTEVGFDEVVDTVVREGHSRIPIYEGTIDNIVGILLVKDLLALMTDPGAREAFDVTALMREPYFVPDAKPVDDILTEFRLSSMHLAIVIDEFGGTYGLVTMEDLLEEIVGEIQDEYDTEEPEFASTPEGDILIDGGVSISEVNERYGLEIPEEDFDTIGGYIFGALGRVPVIGDRVDGLGPDRSGFLEVEEAEERRITRVRLRRSGMLTAES